MGVRPTIFRMEHVFDAGEVRGVLHTPEHPNGDALALTHGAGSNCAAPLLVSLAQAFCDAGLTVLRYDLPFRVAGRGGPTSPAVQARDREGVVRAIEMLRQRVKGRVFAGGHSYGGRQTAMIAAERPGLADALLLLSYPLHPPKKPDRPRTAFFPAWHTPALFVHGTRDDFGTLEELRTAMELIPAPVDLLAVEGAGHDLKPAARMGPQILEAILKTQS
jgi:predicted alpha/beta-hydrolase family hydrolase